MQLMKRLLEYLSGKLKKLAAEKERISGYNNRRHLFGRRRRSERGNN
jgi:hypothetical protein